MLLSHLNQSSSPQTDVSPTLVDILLRRVREHPDQPAYTFLKDGEAKTAQLTHSQLTHAQLTYGQLGTRVQAIAAHLQSTLSPGERALLLMPPGLEFITAFWGCLCAEVIAVPAYPPRRNQRLDRILGIVKDAQPSLILTVSDLLDSLRSKFQDSSLGQLDFLAIDTLPEHFASDWHPVAISPNALALLQYTSGSTGSPKGAMVSHGNLMHNCQLIQTAVKVSTKSRSVSWLPPYHDMGLINGIIQPIHAGCWSILMPPTAFLQKPIRWLKAISTFRATHSGAPNFAYELCVQRLRPEQKETLDLSPWNVAFNGAEPIQAQVMETFAAVFGDCGFQKQAFMPCYGLAESTLMVSWQPIHQAPNVVTVNSSRLTEGQIEPVSHLSTGSTQPLVSCGVPATDLTVRIVNPQTGQQCAAGTIGEIWIAGASVTQGYWQQPELTQTTFQAYLNNDQDGPFLRTGDLGGLLDDELFITGRLKDLIIIRGRNYYPHDIERVVETSHPALQAHSGAAFSVAIDGQEQLVVIYEVDRSYLRQLNVPEIAKAIRQAVSMQFELAVHSVVLLRPNSLLKTSSGKVKRLACRQAFLQGTLNIVGQDQPETLKQNASEQENSEQENAETSGPMTERDIQEWMRSRIAHALKIDPHQVELDTPLASYGLDSAVVVTVTTELEDRLGCELDPAFLFWEYPTIQEMALYLSTNAVSDTAPRHSQADVR
ncbi:MAG: AMP-binding protein [Cyanobacteria bacterium P01_F01_bin.150]